MKIELKEAALAKRDITYPVLARSDVSGGVCTVLFTSERGGLVVESTSPFYLLGHYREGWLNVTEPHCWQVLPAGTKVTFTQE